MGQAVIELIQFLCDYFKAEQLGTNKWLTLLQHQPFCFLFSFETGSYSGARLYQNSW